MKTKQKITNWLKRIFLRDYVDLGRVHEANKEGVGVYFDSQEF